MSAKETLEFIVSYLVDDPDDVQIHEDESGGRTVVYEISVAPNDIGKVIGRNGRTIRAVRNLVKAAAARENRNALVEILD